MGGPNNIHGSSGPKIESSEELVTGSAADFIYDASANLAEEEQGIRDLAVNVLHPMNQMTAQGVNVLSALGEIEEQALATGGVVNIDNPVVEEALTFLLLSDADLNTLTGEITFKDENGNKVELTDLNGDGTVNYDDLFHHYDKDGNGNLSGDELAAKFDKYDTDGSGSLDADELANLSDAVSNGIESFQTLSNSLQQELQYKNGQYNAKWEAFFGGVKAWLDGMRTPAQNSR